MNNLNEQALESAFKTVWQTQNHDKCDFANTNIVWHTDKSPEEMERSEWWHEEETIKHLRAICVTAITAYQAALPQADEAYKAIRKQFWVMGAGVYHKGQHCNEKPIGLCANAGDAHAILDATIEAAIAALKPAQDLEGENKRLKKKLECIEASSHKFCSDCRDKVRDESCLRCQNQRRREALKAVSGRCTPEAQLVIDQALKTSPEGK